MQDKFDFISAGDRPALIAFSSPELLDAAKIALQELGFKVHTAATHGDFLIRFSQIHYEVVIIEELFCANVPEENSTLQALQKMPMNQRRHATIILVGDVERNRVRALVEKYWGNWKRGDYKPEIPAEPPPSYWARKRSRFFAARRSSRSSAFFCFFRSGARLRRRVPQ